MTIGEARITCPDCGMAFWSGLSTLSNGSVCPRCGNRFNGADQVNAADPPAETDEQKAERKARRPGMEVPAAPGDETLPAERVRFVDPRRQNPV